MTSGSGPIRGTLPAPQGMASSRCGSPVEPGMTTIMGRRITKDTRISAGVFSGVRTGRFELPTSCLSSKD